MGYAERLAKRIEQQKAKLEQERLRNEQARALVETYRCQLLRRLGTLDRLIRRYDLESVEGSMDLYVWWKRDHVDDQLATVCEGLRRRYLPEFELRDGHVRSPGEAQTILMLMEASKISLEALIYALLYVTYRSSDHDRHWNPERKKWEAARLASDWARDELIRLGVSVYTTARTWFLPEHFQLKGSPQSSEAALSSLADVTADFLDRWAPIHLSVAWSQQL